MDKLKCPFNNFQPCIGKECAVFMGEYIPEDIELKIGSAKLTIPLHAIKFNRCGLYSIALVLADMFSKILAFSKEPG